MSLLQVTVHGPMCEVGDGVSIVKRELLSLRNASKAVSLEYLYYVGIGEGADSVIAVESDQNWAQDTMQVGNSIP